MTLRAGARPFVPVAPAHVVECAVTGASLEAANREAPQALGDKLIQDLATLMDSVKGSSSRTTTTSKEKFKMACRPSKTDVVSKPGEQVRRLHSSWRKLPAAGLFCPCCITLRPCPFHAVEGDAIVFSDLREADALVKSCSRRKVLPRETWEEPPSPPEAASASRHKRVLPPPPTGTPPPPPPPPPPGLEVEKRVATEKRPDGWKCDIDMSVERSSLPSYLLDDASTDVSHADSEVSSVSGPSSRTRRSPPAPRQNSGARSNRRGSGKDMERLPYRSAVWPNSGPRRLL